MQFKYNPIDVQLAIERFMEVYGETEEPYIVSELQRSLDVLRKTMPQSVILDDVEIECLAEFLPKGE
jgi:hypothetical protein